MKLKNEKQIWVLEGEALLHTKVTVDLRSGTILLARTTNLKRDGTSHGSVASACTHAGWNLRLARSNEAEALHIHLASVSPPALSPECDSFVWVVNNEELHNFSTAKTWEVIRLKGVLLQWTDHVWYKGAIPRHAFHMWLTHLDRLPTRARLASWGMQIDTSCCLCGLHLESRDHIFLHCEVSQELWLKVTMRLGYSPFTFHTWEGLSAWLNHKDTTSPRTLRRLVVQVVIYALWRERNSRYHDSIATGVQALFKILDRQIRDAILAKRHRKAFRNLLQSWLRYD